MTMKLMSIKPTFLLGAIQLALFGVVGYNAIYKPHHAALQVASAKLEGARRTQQTQGELVRSLAQIARYRAQLAPAPDSSWLAREVVALSQQVGVELVTITQETPQVVEPFTRLAVNVQLTATYHQLGTFLDRVERAPHFIRAEQCRITPSPDGHGPAAISLVFSTVYLPPLLGAT